MFIDAYNYFQKIILKLDLIDDNSNNFYNYKGLNFLSKLKINNKNLVIIFHGAIPLTIKNRIVFRGYNYEINNTDIICINDYLISISNEYTINWTLSTNNYNVENIYLELFTHILKIKKYEKVIFTGTSAGGYPSIKFACYFNKIAFIANSQLYLEKYGPFNNLINTLKKNKDNIIYENCNIETHILKNKPEKIIIYNNTDDSTYNEHLIPFLNFIKKNNLTYLVDINCFKYNGIIPEGQTHHHIQFPNNSKHLEYLIKYLE